MEAKQVPLIELLEKVPANARLEIHDPDGMGTKFIPVGKMCHEAITALRAAIEQPRQWQGLTEEEIRNATQAMDAEPLAEGWSELVKFARSIEVKLKEKNT